MKVSTADATPLWTGVIVFAGFLLFLPPVPYWLDAPEFVAAAWNLGHVHPPGHPALMMVLKAFLMLPIGEAGFRANLFSALCGAISAGLVSCLVQVFAKDVLLTKLSYLVPALIGIIAGIGFGWSLSSVIQSMSIEAYSMNAALMLAAVLLALCGFQGGSGPTHCGQLRWRVVGPITLLLAVGLANHHYLTVLAIPAVLAALLRRGPFPGQTAAACGLFLVATIGLMFGYLWARGLVGAWPAWADTSSLSGVWWVASAQVFAGSLGGFEEPLSGIWSNVVKAFALLATNLSPVGVVFGLGGLYLCLRSGLGRIGIVVALFIAGNLASKVLMGILDPENPDDHGYFLGAVAGVATLQGLFCAKMAGLSVGGPYPRWARWTLLTVAATVLFLLAIAPAAQSFPVAAKRSQTRDPPTVLRLIWEEQPTRSVMFLSHYPVYFQAMYQRVVEGVRPDVTLVQSSLYFKAREGRFYAERLRREDGDLEEVVREFVGRGTLDAAAVLRLAALRPVRLDAEDRLVIPEVRFSGWTLEVIGDERGGAREYEVPEPDPTTKVEAHIQNLRLLVPRWSGLVDSETRRVLLRHLASMARTMAALGHRRAGARLVEAALALNPLDRELRSMAVEIAGPDGR